MILVTGATGTTGSEVVKLLSAGGDPVRALVRNPDKDALVAGPGVEIARGDLDRPATLAAALTGVERVFLLSSPDPRAPELQGNLIDAAGRAGVRHLVKLSAIGASPDSPVSLLRWHGEIEKKLEDSGVPFTHLRPHFFMQNFFMQVPAIASEGVVYAPMRDTRISPVDVRDVAAVAAAILRSAGGHEGRTYDLTGPEALSYADMAAKLAHATGRPITYVDVPPEAARQGMAAQGLPDWLADGLVDLFASWKGGQGATVTRVVEATTGKPPRTFDQFAREFASRFSGRI